MKHIPVLLLGAVCSVCIFAQAPTGELAGTIRDATGAVISGASVSVVNEETGVKREVLSDDRGSYTIPLLPPGRYRTSIQHAGFRSVERKGIVLHVNETVNVDYALEVGSVNETVTVMGEAPLLETAQSSQGAVIDNAKVANLPLNMRDPFTLAALTPGVQPGNGFFTPRVFQEQAFQTNFSVNGGASFQNDILLDGTSNTVAGHGQLAMTPSVDAIEEFKVETSNYSAEFGRSGGGIVNIVTKSGTNSLRGTIYEFLRNRNLDANDFFSNRAGLPRPPFVFNQFGFTVGGPVVLPKLYNGHNRTFFFFGYEGARARRASFAAETVPTADMRLGDFSNLKTATGQAIDIYNPFSTRAAGSGYVRDPFPGNRIPAAMLDRVAVNASKYYPIPNQATAAVANNFLVNASQQNDLDTWQWRVDHNITSYNRLFVRMSHDKMTDVEPNFYNNVANDSNTYSGSVQPDWHATISDTHNFGPRTLLDVRAGYARNGFDRRPISSGFDPTQLGFPAALARTAQVLYFPTIQPQGYSGVGARSNDLFFLGADTYSFLPQLTLIRGRHTIKIGGDFRILRHNTFNASSPVGTYSFTKAFTQGPDPLRSTLNAGDGYAAMLLGTMSAGTVQVKAYTSWQTKYSAGYIQDDLKISSRLTLNLGLRYDYETPRAERFNRLSWFDYNASSPIAQQVGISGLKGGLAFAAVNGNPRGWNDPDRNNIAPRFGFAFQPLKKTVLRGGYGITYLPGGTNDNGYGAGQDGFSTTTNLLASADGGLTPSTLLANAWASGIPQPTGSSLGLLTLLGQGVRGDPRWVRVGYMQQWNFSVQRELPGHVLAEASYVGSRGVKIPVTFQMDQLPDQYLALGSRLLDQVANPFYGLVSVGTLSLPTVTRGQLLRPYPQFTGVSFSQNAAGSSTYHAFEALVEKRFTRGLTLLASYTNSKLITDTDSLKGFVGDVSVGVQDNNNRRLERAVGTTDVPQRLVMSYIYELPFGKGKPFLHNGRFINAVFGGWTLAGITTLQRGKPLALTTATNNTNSLGGGSRPNNNGHSAGLDSSERTISRWFNTSVFSQPDPFTFGSTGRLLPDVREDGIRNFDFSTQKNFAIREKLRVQFRGEMFNLFNTPQFGRPGTVFGNPTFGVVSTQANTPRQIQLGLKLLF
jgi:Carboxypeptidase regulatory-like domain/TonB dependent receptor